MDMSVQKFLKRREVAEASRRLVRAYTTDGMMTYDQQTVDSTGAFLVGQLERLDQTLNEPLVEFTWSRDIDIRTDVSMADEVASWTSSAFGQAGNLTPGGLNWISNEGNAIAGPTVDIGKTAQAMRLWGGEVKYTVPELIKSQKLGMPIDAQKLEAFNLKRNMDLDQLVYIGDSNIGTTGLINSAAVTPSNVVNGASGFSQWTKKTPDEILTDVNTLLTNTWAAAGWKVLPNRLLLPPAQYGYLASTKNSQAGNQSILTYVLMNNISTQSGVTLEILPLKWLIGSGVGGTQGVLGTVDRMIAYNKDKKYIQYPMTELARTPLEYRSLFQIVTYYARFGQVEMRYATTVSYADGI